MYGAGGPCGPRAWRLSFEFYSFYVFVRLITIKIILIYPLADGR
jgi:hypothetical protein